jgi:TPR repeat protein
MNEPGWDEWTRAVALELALDGDDGNDDDDDVFENKLKEIAELLQVAVDKGCTRALSSLASKFYHGDGVEQSFVKAAQLYQRGVALGDARCQVCLGSMFELGEGVKRSGAKAVELYALAANQAEPDGLVALGQVYSTGKCGVAVDHAKAFKLFKVAAEAGNDVGMQNLASCNARGLGVAVNEAEAFRWYTKAVEKDNAEAMAGLATCYYAGVGVGKDMAEAVRWWKRASVEGVVAVMPNLAKAYDLGEGIKQDLVAATSWYRQAAEAGDSGAMKELAERLESGRGCRRNVREARKWTNRMYAQSSIDTEKMLGDFDFGEEALEGDRPGDRFARYNKKILGCLLGNLGANAENVIDLSNSDAVKEVIDAKSSGQKCSVCSVFTNLKTCGHCKQVQYCSFACQKKDWPEHKKFCKKLN